MCITPTLDTVHKALQNWTLAHLFYLISWNSCPHPAAAKLFFSVPWFTKLFSTPGLIFLSYARSHFLKSYAWKAIQRNLIILFNISDFCFCSPCFQSFLSFWCANWFHRETERNACSVIERHACSITLSYFESWAPW